MVKTTNQIDIVEVDVDVEWFWDVWDRFLDTQFVGTVASGFRESRVRSISVEMLAAVDWGRRTRPQLSTSQER